MMKLTLFILFFITSCTSSTENKKSKYLVLNELWEKHSTRSEVIKTLGNDYVETDSGILFLYPNSKRPEIGLFFSSSEKLTEMFAFMNEQALNNLKSTIDCHWQESEEKKDIAHYQRIIKKGICNAHHIRYETYLDLNGYEVRWKR